LKEHFEHWDRIEFHMVPPLLAQPWPDGRIRKLTFGPWLMRVLEVLAPLRRLRGTPLDVFGHTAERRLERQLVRDYEALVDELLRGLAADKLELAVKLARLPEGIRGYGHVKVANVASVKAQWADWLQRYRGAPYTAASLQPSAAMSDTR